MTLDMPLLLDSLFDSKTLGEGVGADKNQGVININSKEILLYPIFFNGTQIFMNHNYPAQQMDSTDFCGFLYKVPADWNEIQEAKFISIPNTTETVQWDLRIDIAALGENSANEQRVFNNNTQAVVANIITELEATTHFSKLNPGDYIGIKFESDTDHIVLLALKLIYR